MTRTFIALTSTLLIVIMMVLAGCTKDPRVDKLQQEITSTKNEISSLKGEIEQLKQQRDLEKFFMDFNKIAYLIPGSKGYSIIQFDLGVLTISINNVVEYNKGSLVTFSVGNPLSTTINGLSAKIEYGEVDEIGMARSETVKTKEITFYESLRSGSWTNVTLVLDNVPPSKLGFVCVREVKHTGISLMKE